jgi:hypothetical protein
MKETIFPPKSAASLLTMLLLMAIVGVMIIVAGRVLGESGRAVTLQSVREEAYQAALTGIQEGLQHLSENAPGAAELGDVTTQTSQTNYSHFPLRRGYSRAENSIGACVHQTARSPIPGPAALDRSCPYYDLSVRDRIGYLSFPGSVMNPPYQLSSKDFPSGVTRMIPVRAQQLILNIASNVNMLSPAVEWAPCLTSDPASCQATQSLAPGQTLIHTDVSSYNYSFLQLTFYHTAPASSPVILAEGVVTAGLATPIIAGLGYYAIESTGYAGGVQVTLRYVVRGDGAHSMSEVSSRFNQLGAIKP